LSDWRSLLWLVVLVGAALLVLGLANAMTGRPVW
jgi:hypothetical protein